MARPPQFMPRQRQARARLERILPDPKALPDPKTVRATTGSTHAHAQTAGQALQPRDGFNPDVPSPPSSLKRRPGPRGALMPLGFPQTPRNITIAMHLSICNYFTRESMILYPSP